MFDLSELGETINKLGGGINIKSQKIQILQLQKKDDISEIQDKYDKDIIPEFLQNFNYTVFILGESPSSNISQLCQSILEQKDKNQIICLSIFSINFQKRFYYQDLLSNEKQTEFKNILDVEIIQLNLLEVLQKQAIAKIEQDIIELLIIRFSLIESQKKVCEFTIINPIKQDLTFFQKMTSDKKNLCQNFINQALSQDSLSMIIINPDLPYFKEQQILAQTFQKIQCIATKQSQSKQLFVNFYSYEEYKSSFLSIVAVPKPQPYTKSPRLSKELKQAQSKQIKQNQSQENNKSFYKEEQEKQEEQINQKDKILHYTQHIKELQSEIAKLKNQDIKETNKDFEIQKEFEELKFILKEINPNLKQSLILKFEKQLFVIQNHVLQLDQALIFQQQVQKEYIDFLVDLQEDLQNDYGKFEPLVKKTNHKIRTFIYNKIIQK